MYAIKNSYNLVVIFNILFNIMSNSSNEATTSASHLRYLKNFNREIIEKFQGLRTRPLSSFKSLNEGDAVYAWFNSHRGGYTRGIAIYKGKEKRNHIFAVATRDERGRARIVKRVKTSPKFLIRLGSVNETNFKVKTDITMAKALKIV